MFLKLPPETKYFESFSFGVDKRIADELLTLVLNGKKRATCSSYVEYVNNNVGIPSVGDYSIVLDGNGIPKCVIRTAQVTLMKFKDMTFEICSREGEDATLDSWRVGHIKHFSILLKKFDIEFSEELDIVFEDFELIYYQT